MGLKDQHKSLKRNRGYHKFTGQIQSVFKEGPPRAKDSRGRAAVTRIIQMNRQRKISSKQNEMLKTVQKIGMGTKIDKDEQGYGDRMNLKNDDPI